MKQALDKLSKGYVDVRPDIFSTIKTELDIVQDNLSNKLPAVNKLLLEMVRYIFSAGGKRLRPVLCMLFAKATGGIKEKHFVLAELSELIHTASLVHDDVIDSAKLRRGKETLNIVWNEKLSVIVGDFLFAQASVRLGELENTEIVKIYANVLSELCNGEIDQYVDRFNIAITWDEYIKKSKSKTASLFAACCQSAAILNRMPPEVVESCYSYGLNLGIGFQIIDDVLDFTKKTEEIGKENAQDLKQGIITAPTLYALSSDDSRSKILKSLIESRFSSDSDFEKAVGLVFELGGCDKAKSLAKDYLNKAKKDLNFIDDKFLHGNLYALSDFIINKA